MEFWEIFWGYLVSTAMAAWDLITGPVGIFVLACGIFFAINVALCLTWDWAMYTKLDTNSLAFRASYYARRSVGGVLYFLLSVATLTCLDLLPGEDPDMAIWGILFFVAYLLVMAYTAWCVHCNRVRYGKSSYTARDFWLTTLP